MNGSMRQYAGRVLAGLAIALGIAGHAASFYEIGALKRLDRWLYDARVTLGVTPGIDERIVIVDIDERSLAEIGRWPWRRDVIAALIDRLCDDYHAKVVGFDIVFAEPDGSSGLPVLDKLVGGPLKEHAELKTALDGLRPELDHDARLARALAERPIVLGYYLSSGYQSGSSGSIGRPALTAAAFEGRQVAFSTWAGFGGNLELFQKVAGAAGHFNVIPDEDGITRRVPLLAEYRGDFYEALSLAMVRRLLGTPPLRLGLTGGVLGGPGDALEWLGVGRLRIPIDENAAALVPYRGPGGSFSHVSATDIYNGRVDAAVLRERIVLVGTSAPGLYDLRATPVANVYPGVEAHANLIAGMLDESLKSRPAWLEGSETLAVVLLGLALAILLPRWSPLAATSAAAALLVLLAAIAWIAWRQANLVMAIAPLAALVASLFGLNMVFGYFVEVRAKRQFTQLFGEYVPPELVDRMVRDPRKYRMYSTEPRNEILTVLFADLRGFTTISESLAPHELRVFLNDYLTAMSQVIHQAGGTVDKYMGDAIMAFWGAPVADPEHARHAVTAAVRMQATVADLRNRMASAGGPALAIGVGINTGLMNVGDMGSKLRRSYTVLGDPVNLASRLESLTKYYGVGIILGERTREMVPDVVCRELDRVRVKGKGEAVSIFEPLGLAGEDPAAVAAEMTLWNRMLRAYRGRDWDDAELTLLNLQRLHARTTLYELYLSRIVRFRSAPPPADWDGVTVFDRK